MKELLFIKTFLLLFQPLYIIVSQQQQFEQQEAAMTAALLRAAYCCSSSVVSNIRHLHHARLVTATTSYFNDLMNLEKLLTLLTYVAIDRDLLA